MNYNLGKFRLLLVLFACICLFLSISCIYASDDIDATVWNNFSDVEDNALIDEADISANPCDEISDDTSHHKNPRDIDGVKEKPHYEHGIKKPVGPRDGAKSALHKKPINVTGGKVKPHHERFFNDNQFTGFGKKTEECPFIISGVSKDSPFIEGQINYENPEKAINNNVEGIWIANNHVKRENSLNFNNSVYNAVKLDSKTVEDMFCCCKEGQCNHNLNTEIHYDQKIIDGENILNDDNVNVDDSSDDLAYSYNRDAQIINFRLATVSILGSCKEEESNNSRNCNFKRTISLNQELGQVNVEYSFKNLSSDLGMNAENLSVYSTNCDSNINGLEINLISDKLNVEDYNLEYYIFTNPYIIVDNLSFKNTPINNNIQNHSFNANQTTSPSINQNNSILNIETIFNKEFLIKNCSVNDYREFLIKNFIVYNYYGKLSALDCTLIKNTTFCKMFASLIEADNLKTRGNNVAIMIGQNHIKLSTGNDMATILIFGVIK